MRRKKTPDQLFDRIESTSVRAAVVSQIEDLILSGVLSEGDLLPGERELAEQFGVSRPKVREALSELAANELVRIVANDGVYVARLGGTLMSPALVALFNRSSTAVRDYLEYRRENEGFACRLAAQRATEHDRSELLRLLAALEVAEKSQDNARATELDFELHHAIAFAAHNRTLTHMMTALYNLNRSSIFLNRNELMNISETAATLHKQHTEIVESICQAQPARAQKAGHAHIDYVISSIERVFARQNRESLSKKRYVQRSVNATQVPASP